MMGRINKESFIINLSRSAIRVYDPSGPEVESTGLGAWNQAVMAGPVRGHKHFKRRIYGKLIKRSCR